MPKKAKPKMPKAMSASQEDYKPPTIDDVKSAVLESLVCWVWYLNPFHNHNEDEYYIERIYENHLLLIDFDQSQTDRVFDAMLDMKTNWLDLRVISVVGHIGKMIWDIERSQNLDIHQRQDVVNCAKEIGLPSTFHETLSIYNLVKGAKTPTDKNEKYHGLRLLFERMHRQGATTPTHKQVAEKYLSDCGWGSGLQIKRIVHFIKNNSMDGEWTGYRYERKKPPG